MTIQRLATQEVTISFKSPEGGALVDTPLTVDGTAYTDSDYTTPVTDPHTDGAGEFTFYGKPGSVVTVTPDSPIGQPYEPIQFVGVDAGDENPTAAPSDVEPPTPVTEQVSDLSLVGADNPTPVEEPTPAEEPTPEVAPTEPAPTE